MPDAYEPQEGTLQPPAPHHVRPILLVLLGATIIIALSVVAMLRIGARPDDQSQQPVASAPAAALVVSPAELTLSQGGYLSPLSATYNGEDVTQQAYWYSDDPAVAVVASLEPNRGQVSALGVGKTLIHAAINGVDATARVTVVQPGLRVECMPTQSTATVGEKVLFIAEYKDPGVPFYMYEWTGDDGLSDTLAYVRHTYTTPGVKKVHFKTTDMAGAVAEDDCEVTITE